MRPMVLIVLLVSLATVGACRAQEKIVQSFDGAALQTTPKFQVADKWEVRWKCPDDIQITVLGDDGAVVAGVTASSGSLDLPKGGTYSLRISRVDITTLNQWHVSVVQPDTVQDVAAVASDASTNAATSVPPASTNVAAVPAVPRTSPTLTGDQARGVVIIKGDAGEGTGFLTKSADGPVVVTNIHVLSANPNIKIFTTTGALIKILGYKGASDRDLAMISIQDDHYDYLELATDIAGTVQVGDEIITPGNSEGGEVMLNTKGTVLGLGPQMVEMTNPIYHGNSGGPIFHVKSGKVLAAVEGARKVTPTDELDKASLANADSAIVGSMRYFGLRLDNVPSWESYDWDRFLNETTFIKNFHDLSRCLDSYMNGASYERAKVASDDENGRPNARYYVKNQKLQSIHDNYHRLATDADASQKLDATREMVMDLQQVGATDMDAIQTPTNFYAFDQIRVGYEIKYRKWLQKEIESYGSKISDMGH